MKSGGTKFINVLLAALACVLLAASCSSSDDSLTEDTAELRVRLDNLISNTEYVDDNADLDACPFDAALMTSMFDSVVAAELTGFTDNDDDLIASSFQLPISGATLVGCFFAPAESDSGIGLDVSPAPSGLESFLREFYDPEQTGTTMWEINEDVEHRGGTFFQVYISDSDEAASTASDLYWIDDNVMITAYGFGPGNERLDLDLVQERFIAELEDIVTTSP